MKKLFILLTVLLCFCVSNTSVAQTGGRKREHRNQKRGSLFKRNRSTGHADKFARGTNRRGVFARMFRKDRPAWVYHSTKSGRAQKRETKHLFTRYRTKGKRYKDGILAKQNAERSRKRVRGNSTFHKRKYNGS
ncbi:MAG: hypothetical protein SFY56_11470 [Bacteroidota bacterium]|nr:hypothetical protein [Bacteroidota bacterium]